MPIREFQCLVCHHTFESLIFKKEEESELACPCCGSAQLEKILSRFARIGGDGRSPGSTSGCTSCSSKSCSTCH